MVSLFDESNVKISASLARENIVLEDVQSAFEFDMAIYTDMSFTEIRSKDYKYNVPEKIFVGIVTEVKINEKIGAKGVKSGFQNHFRPLIHDIIFPLNTVSSLGTQA